MEYQPNIALRAHSNCSVLSRKKTPHKISWKAEISLLHSGARGAPSRSFVGDNTWLVVDSSSGVLLVLGEWKWQKPVQKPGQDLGLAPSPARLSECKSCCCAQHPGLDSPFLCSGLSWALDPPLQGVSLSTVSRWGPLFCSTSEKNFLGWLWTQTLN